MKTVYCLMVILINAGIAHAQNNVGINNNMPHASAVLDIASTNKGLLIPRMNQSQRTTSIPSPAPGLLVYQTDATTGFYFFNGSNWDKLATTGTAAGNPLFASRTTSVVINSATMTDVITLNLDANKTYFFDGAVIALRGGTSGTMNSRITYSGTATTDFGIDVNSSLLAGTAFSTTSFDYEAAGFSNSVGSAPSKEINVSGYLRTTTAGTLSIKVARGATNSTVDITVREGSYLRATPLN